MSPVGARKQNRHRFWVDFENFLRGRYAPNKPYDDRLPGGVGPKFVADSRCRCHAAGAMHLRAVL